MSEGGRRWLRVAKEALVAASSAPDPIVAVLRSAARAAATKAGLAPTRLARSRLGDGPAIVLDWDAFDLGPHELGHLYEALLRVSAAARRTGSYFTPPEIVHSVVERALAETPGVPERVCDPAAGAGAFLIEVWRALVQRGVSPRGACSRLTGIDRSEVALAVSEVALWLALGDPSLSPADIGARLVVADTLTWDEPGTRFDLVIGNPPWIAYAGRAAQPLPPEERAFRARRFSAWRGYPTLHGLFVERAAELAPRGVVALLLPSPIADLAGYAATRSALTRTHGVVEPLVEHGQDAFLGVTQPCFALVATPREPSPGSPAHWRLEERSHRGATSERVTPPPALLRLAERERVPAQAFGELGFQSTSRVTRDLFARGSEPRGAFTYPLLQGRDVHAFHVAAPRLWLDATPERLQAAGARARPRDDYRRVAFVVRQTARIPIAALHDGLPFRNSLLAGFAHPALAADLAVGLLNSVLFAALHLAAQRDARQATFPQVKIAHLRALPAPDAGPGRAAVVDVVARATAGAASREWREPLNRAVAALYGITATELLEIERFVAARL